MCLIETLLNVILREKSSILQILHGEIYTRLERMEVYHFRLGRNSQLGFSWPIIHSPFKMPYEQVIWWGWRWCRWLLSNLPFAPVTSSGWRIFYKDEFVRVAVFAWKRRLHTLSILWNISGRMILSWSFSRLSLILLVQRIIPVSSQLQLHTTCDPWPATCGLDPPKV